MTRTAWVPMYCSDDRQARVAAFRLAAEEWQLVSVGGPEPGGGAAGGLPVGGRFGFAPGYPGCPGCGAASYVRCGSCGELGCWVGGDALHTCGKCGRRAPISGVIESLGALDIG